MNDFNEYHNEANDYKNDHHNHNEEKTMNKTTDRITLKALKYATFASQETHCYQAKLYLDNTFAAHVENDGRGGCDSQHIVDRAAWSEILKILAEKNTPQTDLDRAEKIRARIKWLVEVGDAAYCENDTQEPDAVLLEKFASVLELDYLDDTVESICCELVNEWIHMKDLKKAMSKRVLMLEDGKIMQTKPAPNAATRKHWAAHYVAEGLVVLNKLPIKEALALYTEHSA